MKTLLKNFFTNLLAFIFAWQYFPAVQLVGRFEDILLAAAVLTLLDKFLKPIIKFITLPLRSLTFGLFEVVIASFVFYLTTEITEGLIVVDFLFPGITTDFLIVPPFDIYKPWSYAVSALFVVFFNKFLYWVFKKKVFKD